MAHAINDMAHAINVVVRKHVINLTDVTDICH